MTCKVHHAVLGCNYLIDIARVRSRVRSGDGEREQAAEFWSSVTKSEWLAQRRPYRRPQWRPSHGPERVLNGRGACARIFCPPALLVRQSVFNIISYCILSCLYSTFSARSHILFPPHNNEPPAAPTCRTHTLLSCTLSFSYFFWGEIHLT